MAEPAEPLLLKHRRAHVPGWWHACSVQMSRTLANAVCNSAEAWSAKMKHVTNLRSQAQSELSACEVNTYTSRVLTMPGASEQWCMLWFCTCAWHMKPSSPSCRGCRRARYLQAEDSNEAHAQAQEAPISRQTGSRARSAWPCCSVARGGTGTSDTHDTFQNYMGLRHCHAYLGAWPCIILLPQLMP